MKEKRNLYRVLSKGGVLTPDLLLRIINIAEDAGNEFVFIGSRQDLLFYLPEITRETDPDIILHQRSSGIQNVVSSYVCVDILPSTSWVHAGTYLSILEKFTYNHTLRVNIVDPRQNLVPLFYGHLNFVASPTPNYWSLYMNPDNEKDAELWPELIFTDDIAEFARELEQLIAERKLTGTRALRKAVAELPVHKNMLPNATETELPKGFFPYYEGFNKIDGKDLYWAGFYWRNNQYPTKFLKEICLLCRQTNISRISFTPWKTFLIKEIEQKHKPFWDELIGRYGINMRHSSFELNWHLPLLDRQALKLKRYLVSEFDKVDIRTFGLSFAIQSKPGERFTTVVIRSKSRLPVLGRFDFTRTYSIEYAYDFNPNNNHYTEYAGNLSKAELPQKLNEISKRYYATLFADNYSAKPKNRQPAKRNVEVFQCGTCYTVYDERFGDLLAGIKPGTPFKNLPGEYCCQLCENPKSGFRKIEITEPAEY
jgi:rubredoxin